MLKSRLDEQGGENPVLPIGIEGASMAILKFIVMLADTWPIETDEEWWAMYLATKWWN